MKYVWYESPKRTKNKCPKTAFADPYLHRIGVYTTTRPNDNGADGYFLACHCVECGKKFKYNGFILMRDYKKKKLMDYEPLTRDNESIKTKNGRIL
jgi:hypothetical protein